MEKFIKGYKDVMTYIGILGLIGFIVSVMIQVIARTFLPTAPNWTEEAARYLFIYMVAFGGMPPLSPTSTSAWRCSLRCSPSVFRRPSRPSF